MQVKTNINNVQNTTDFSGLGLILNGLMLRGNAYCALMSQRFRLVMEIVFSGTKKKRTIQIVTSVKLIIQHLSCCVCVCVGGVLLLPMV